MDRVGKRQPNGRRSYSASASEREPTAREAGELAAAHSLSHVDVYLGPGNGGGGGGGGHGGGRGGAAGAEAAEGATPQRQSAGQRHSAMANLATYPAVAVPNGFNATGLPTSITFFARPFGESELLALVKAYQDATGFHLKHPALDQPRT